MMNSKVFNIDCRVFMKNIPDKYYDIAIVDPPYGINALNMRMGTAKKNGKLYESSAWKSKKGRLNHGRGKFAERVLNTMDCDWDNQIPTPEYFKQLFRISKHQIIWGGNYFNLPATRCVICWDKLQPWDNFSQWEMAWTSFDKPAKIYRISNTGGSNKEKKIHPTQKPVALYDCLYRDFVLSGMKAFDSHLGSGSHRISADKAGVSLDACETSPVYFNAQDLRYAEYKKQLTIGFCQ